MSRPVTPLHDEAAASDRRVRILDAAERCFVRAGFHRTTMQDVAAEAAMSPGNLYRYFASKDAIVAGLAERDRAEVAEGFGGLAEAEDIPGALAALVRHHLCEGPRAKSVLCLEIWAESTRNPAFAAIAAEFQRDIHARLVAVFLVARGRGALAPGVDPAALASLLATFADGLFTHRAILPGFDAEGGVAQFVALTEAAMAGRVALPPFAAARAEGAR